MSVILGIILTLIALIFLAVGSVALLGGFQQKRRCCASAPGTVTAVHMEEKSRGRGKGTVNIYTPEFSFDVKGQTHSYRGSFGSMRQEFKEGQQVTICYDPIEPTNFYVENDPNTSSQGGIMCLIIGVLLAVAAVAMFV